MEKIDYAGMRKIYEKTQNQQALEVLVHTYCAEEKTPETATRCDSVLKGVTLSEQYIENISNPIELIALITNEALPFDKLMEKARKWNCTPINTYLYQQGSVPIKTVENALLKHSLDDDFFDTLAFIVNKTSLHDFNKIAFTAIKKKLIKEIQTIIAISPKEETANSCLYGPEGIITNNIDTIFTLLYCTKSDAESQTIAAFIIKGIEYPSQKIIKQTIAFMRTDIIATRRIPASNLLNYLHSRPDFISILNAIEKTSEENYNACFNIICEEDLSVFINISVIFIGRGSFELTGFTLRSFPKVFERRIDILNAWVKNDCEIELDIFGPSLLEGKLPDESLDEKYLAALSGKTEQKIPQMRQVEPTDN